MFRHRITHWILLATLMPAAAAGQRILPIGAQFRINDAASPDALDVGVCGGAFSGDFVVTWRGIRQNGAHAVYERLFDATGAPGSVIRVAAVGTPEPRPSVACEPGGRTVIAWEAADTGSPDLGIHAAAQMPTERLHVNVTTAGDQVLPTVARSRTGDFTVLWESPGQDGDGDGIFAQSYIHQFGGGARALGEFRVNLTTVNQQDAPAACIDGSGRLVAVWESLGQDGSGWGIYGQRFDLAGNRLGAEFAVNGSSAGDQQLPDVGCEVDGSFTVVWESAVQDGDSGGVFARRFASDGQPLGPELQINTHTAGRQWGARIARNDAGEAFVVWQSDGQDGSGAGVYGRFYDGDGVPRSGELRINGFTSGNQAAPDVSMTGRDTAIVVWRGAGPGDAAGAWGRRFSITRPAPLPPVANEFVVNTSTPGYQSGGAVSSDAAGNFVVIWRDSYLDRLDLTGQLFSSTGARRGSEFQVNVPGLSTRNIGYPRVASDAAGNFVVVWTREDQNSDQTLLGRRFDSTGAPRSGEFVVAAGSGGNGPDGPQVAGDATGGFEVIWEDGARDGIFGKRFDSLGAPQGSEFPVNSTPGDFGGKSLAAEPAGGFVVAWRQYTGTGHTVDAVLARRFDAEGSALGEEILVKDVSATRATDAWVSTAAAGDFVIVWAEIGKVSGRRYSSLGGPLGEEFDIVEDRAGDMLKPRVAHDTVGNFVVAWTNTPATLYAVCQDQYHCTPFYAASADGSGSSVHGRLYRNDGTPQGHEFLVNSTTGGDEAFPSVTAGSGGQFVVVWDGPGAYGPGSEVFAQRYVAASTQVPAAPPRLLIVTLLVLGVFALRRAGGGFTPRSADLRGLEGADADSQPRRHTIPSRTPGRQGPTVATG